MVFSKLEEKLMKFAPLSMPKFGTTTSKDDDNDDDKESATKKATRHLQRANMRMRNIFAAPLEMIEGNLDDLKTLLTPKSKEEVDFLSHAFANHFVFQHLSPKEKKFLIGAMSLREFNKDDIIIEQGTPGEFLYVIQSGSVHFIVNDEVQPHKGMPGEVFGELSLLYDCLTAATVQALCHVKVWRVSQNAFRRIKAAHAIEGDKEKRDEITQVSFFKSLPQEIIYKLADSLLEYKFKAGERLVKKGQDGTTMFILKEGWVVGSDLVTPSGQKLADIKLGKGEHFGEVAIVNAGQYKGNVTAATDGVAWCLSKERFQHAVGHLNLNELILKAQDKKLLSVLPIMAYSDIDSIETELLAERLQDYEHPKGHVYAEQGKHVKPALFVIRSGSVTLSKGSDTRTLQAGEAFGFGGDTLIMTNHLKQEQKSMHFNFLDKMFHKDQVAAGEKAIKSNQVVAAHSAIATEDTKVGMLTIDDITAVLYDPLRLGRRGSAKQNAAITNKSLQKIRVLGAGTFGTVWLTRDGGSDTPYALKVQYKRQIIEFNQAKGVIREKKVMEKMNHPFVMSLVSAQQDTKCLYMVMDFMQGGELASVIRTRKRSHLAEGSAKFYAAGILEGLSYMHRRNFVYRDLKGENVLLDNDGYAVIVDLGFAKFVPDKTFTFCGTPLFIAPEIVLSKGHDKSADIWSFGVLVFEMLTGENPFYTDEKMSQIDLFKAICKGKFKFPRESHINPDASDLIVKLLALDPKERLGCLSRADLDIREHAWFRDLNFGELYRKELTVPWKPEIRNPFDGSNFGNWSELESKDHKDLKPLSEREQQQFVAFS